MKKLCNSITVFCIMASLIFQMNLSGLNCKDYVYRRATAGDQLAVLDVMNAIERSKVHKYIVLYPYNMRAHKVDDLIANKSLFIAASPEALVSTVTVSLLPFNDFENQMDETSITGWRTVYGSDDLFITSDMWYTEPHHRNHSIFTTLLGFSLQAFVPRVKQYVHEDASLNVHVMVDFIEDKDNRDLVKKLVKCMSALFQEFVESLHKTYFPHSTAPITYSLNTCDVTKSFYNPFVNELEVAITRPAKRYIFSAMVD